MQRTKRLMVLVAALSIMTIVTGATPAEATRETSRSTSDVMWFADPATPVGTSRLVRTGRGVAATFRTTGLAAREAITLWWVVFNDPEGCTDPCGEDDIFVDGDPAKGINEAGVAAADIVAAYATGTVANQNGEAYMAAWLSEGGGVREVLFGAEPTLKHSDNAEIHLVARSHGAAIPGSVMEQVSSYAGGCDVFLHPPAVPSAEGECADIQFAVHQP